jgi:hypothetical protein
MGLWEARMASTEKGRTAKHNVVAAFPNMEMAQEAIGALEWAGIEANEISLLGKAAVEAAEKSAHSSETSERDAEVATRVGGRAAFGAVTGGIAGGAIGLAVGVVLFVLADVGPTFGVAVAGVIGTVAGFIIGGIFGGESGLTISRASKLSMEDIGDQRVLVGVHSDNPEDVQKGAEVLRGKRPLDLNVFDESGRVDGDGRTGATAAR